MKVLVIPDVHLKPWIIERASELLKENAADRAVCLMDIADEWRQAYNLPLYVETYDTAIRFAKEHPETLWCCGNHDICYKWNRKVPGNSKLAPRTVCEKVEELRDALPDKGQLAYLQRIDSVIFSHGGLADEFVHKYVPAEDYDDVNAVFDTINGFGCDEMWQDLSPIWLRPQHDSVSLYRSEEFLQVVGHTPVRKILKEGNLISCDVFSVDDFGKPVGTEEFPVIDTVTWEYHGVR